MSISKTFFSKRHPPQWASPFDNFEEDKKIYIKANTYAYQEQFLSLKIRNEKTSLLPQEFQEELLFFKKYQLRCHWARLFDTTEKFLGFCLFEQKEESCFYIREIAIDPKFWGKGIARYLIFSILEKFPETKKLVLVTCLSNKRALFLYHKCGFKPISTETDTALKHFSSQEFQGFEWNRKSFS